MTSVTLERKHELLVEARTARLSWIQSSSSPYQQRTQRQQSDKDDYLDENYHVTQLKSSRIGQVMNNTISVVSMLNDLYALNSSGTDIIGENSKLAAVKNGDLQVADITNRLRLSQQTTKNVEGGIETNMMITVDSKIAQSYRDMIHKFCLPECSDIVYSMKHFVGTFSDNAEKLEKGYKEDSSNDENNSLEQKAITRLASSIQKFLQTLYTTVYLHPLWNNNEHDDARQPLSDEIKNSLEIFVYSKCRPSIFNALSNYIKDDDDMLSRLDFLQFVNPSHLDMHCLIDDEEKSIEGGSDEKKMKTQTWRTHLATPINTLQTLPMYNSPSQMLSCILNAYRQVNEALISVSSQDIINYSECCETESDSQIGVNSGKKMPGADDLLPALILTTVAARPSQVVSILKFIEGFATEEEMRGEAGYAYTNLYCAVQFIKELDLSGEGSMDGSSLSVMSRSIEADGKSHQADGGSTNGDKKPSLSISLKDLNAMKKRFASQNSNRNKNTPENTTGKDTSDANKEKENENENTSSLLYAPIPIGEVRAARLRGEEILPWARLRWMEERVGTVAESDNAFIGSYARPMMNGTNLDKKHEHEQQKPRELPLPEGFTRIYNYVSTEPDDVRMSDIPSLLKEYRMLVLGVETFLADQTTRQNDYWKEEIKRARNKLEMDASDAEAAVQGVRVQI